MTSAACAPGATRRPISARCMDIASVSAAGRTSAAVARRCGQTAPKMISPLVALVAWRTRSGSSLGPNAGQRTLLTDAGFVLEPDFDRLVFGVLGKLRRDRCGKVFLNASWASWSVWG